MKTLKKTTYPNFNYRVFIASSIALLFLSFLSLIWFQKQKQANDWISHTYEVKLKIEKSFGLLLEAESNQRGFILGKDSAYLRQIRHAESLLYSNLAQLKSLTSDNKNQVGNFNNLQKLILARIARLQVVLDSSGLSANTVVPHSLKPGKEIMDSVHNQIRTMEAAEDALMYQRNFSKKKENDRLVIFIVSFSVLAFTILMWSFLKIKNESSLRARAQMDASILENLVNQRTTEINNMNIILSEQNDRLERKNRDLTSFTNIASHDLKEPLRKIEMFSGRLVQTNPDNLNKQSLEYLDKIVSQTKRMRTLIESILKYAQTDDETLGFRQTDLNDIAGLAVENLNEMIQEKKAIVGIKPLPGIFCSPDQMTQVFINLLENGLKYSRAGVPPLLEIKCSPLPDLNDQDSSMDSGWQIDFCDNGIGFDNAYATKIFEIFQRLHSNDEYPGTGIGLAICKKIIENHQGRIIARSVVDKGSVFSVILPANKTRPATPDNE